MKTRLTFMKLRHQLVRSIVALTFAFGMIVCAHAQRAPRIGFIYPAGGQRAMSFEVLVGGQGLDAPTGAIVSGEGVSVQIIDHSKPLGAQEAGYVREMQEKFRAMKREGKVTPATTLPVIRQILREAKVPETDLRRLSEYDRRRNDPKQQQNAQLGEAVRARFTIAENAEPGMRLFRLRAAGGLSNPMRFIVGEHPEALEAEPLAQFDFEHYSGGAFKKGVKHSAPTPTVSMPVTINGRIFPGEEDLFSIHARKDDRLVVSVQARNLIPYLADAVPGWFQAVVSLTNPDGYEVAYADDYRFDPDPVLFYKIPYDGEFRIKVRDSIYRGRDDFVYRITIGQLPFIVGISPLGAKSGTKLDITFSGGNLGESFRQKYTAPDQPGTVLLQAATGPYRSNFIPFQIDTLNEFAEREPNNSNGVMNEIDSPAIINGSIDKRGDADHFRIKGRGNRPMVFEVFARRYGSPLDSNLTLFDAYGKELGSNDDHEDQAAGLTTHHADSRLVTKLPPGGECVIRVTDTQNQFGPNHTYRLRIAQARPSFALRITPSSLNASPGGNAKLTVHALRFDGFDGEIALKLKSAPSDFKLNNATVPAGKDVADISLAIPSGPRGEPVAIAIQGEALIDEKKIVVDAIPAEDMMQAFIYRHLVPVDALLVDVREPVEKPASSP